MRAPWRSARPASPPSPPRVADYPPDDLLLDRQPITEGAPSDCCVALASHRVLLPATAGRPRPAELLLCGHHLRRSAAVIRALEATVYDRTGHRIATALTAVAAG